MRKLKLSTVLTLLAVLMLIVPVSADSEVFPDLILLPVGFRPEGIEVGRGTTFYVGSLADGAIYRGDLRTGEGGVLVTGQTGMVSVGLDYDARSNAVFVAGGPTGMARVYDGDSGALLASFQFVAGPGSFINDAIVTRDAAYFTNSFAPVLYKVDLGPGGELPASNDFDVIPLSGDYVQASGFNVNGIEASPNGEWLIIVQSGTGFLFRVDPETGVATRIDLGGELVTAGDGLLLRGSRLYVMRNQVGEITVIDLSADYTSGVVVDRLTNDAFDVATTIAEFGNALYAVNAKFGNPDAATIPYEVVRVPLN